jgi:hypothetical protein
LCLEIVLEPMTLTAIAVWERLYSSHREFLDGATEVHVDGRACPAHDVAKWIERGGRPHFNVRWGGEQSLDYSHVANSELSFVSVEGCVSADRDAESWLSHFLDESFRQARLFDGEYEFWQNVADPLEYRARGRSWEGLPMRPNGLPPPLGQMVIDTSHNPGRRVLRRGFVEAVGSPMWLGEAFWSLAGIQRDTVCSQPWLRCETLRAGVVRLRPAEAPFTTAGGEAGELQDRLRRLLFPRSA